MQTFTVDELMVPLSEYATVSVEATLYDAILALEKAQEEFDQSRYRHRAILVFDKNNKIVGKISQIDALEALEPKYAELLPETRGRQMGFSNKFVQGMLDQFSLWASPMDDICERSMNRKVVDFMHTPTEGEYVSHDTSLDVAMHQLIVGHHQSLLVTDMTGEIVGVLRLTDVFAAIFHRLKECKPTDE
ncbi:MAG: CBS domain-containing protein [Desulfobacterales bacterium]|nr:CBS domain-containing protein [Desulfobacterales bacterium]